jgi:hypothetical protein
MKRALNKLPMGQRVAAGKKMELRIIDSMNAAGFAVTAATAQEDQYQKIDGWLDGQSLQIKYRETGNDILFEVYKDWDRGIEGRDLCGKADLYACVNLAGQGVIVRTTDIKNMVRAALPTVRAAGSYKSGGLDIKLRPDAYHGQLKCVAFIDWSALNIIGRFTLKVEHPKDA